MAKLKVRMLAHLAGPELELEIGSEQTLDAEFARRLIDAEYAVPAAEKRSRKRGKGSPVPETATDSVTISAPAGTPGPR